MDNGSSAASMARRTALGVIAGAGAGALLWPYTPKGYVDVPRGRVELRYWEKWTGIEGAALQTVVDRFNHSQDRIWVHLVPVSDITSKAMVAIGGGDPPDLVGLYSYSVPTYANARAVMPLDEFEGHATIDPEGYVPGVRDLLWHEGRPWAGVNTCYTLAIYYNRSLLRGVNHDPGKLPRTIDELDDLSGKLTRFDTAGRLEQAGFLQNVPGWWNYFWPIMFGGRLYDETRGRAMCAEPRCVRAFEWVRATAARFGVAATTAFASGYGRNIHSAQDPFMSGRMAMIVQGPWLANFIRTLTPSLDYVAAPVPVATDVFDPDRPTGLLEADVLMIPRGCPHPEESYTFMTFMQRQDVQEELATAHCKPSPFRLCSPGFIEQHPNRSIRAFDAIAKSSAAQILPRTTAWKAYSDLINPAFDRTWSGSDPAATLAAVQVRAQQMIDTAEQRRRERDRIRNEASA